MSYENLTDEQKESADHWRDVIRSYINGEMGSAAIRGLTFHNDGDAIEDKDYA